MTDDLDLALRDRLGRLAAEVQVKSPTALATVPALRVRRRPMGLASLAPVLGLVLIGTVIASLSHIGPFAAGSLRPTESSTATPTASGTAGADNGIYVVNVDAETVDILIDDKFVDSFPCGTTAEILSMWRMGPPPWTVEVRSAATGGTIRSLSLEGPLPKGIVLRDGAVLRGPWPTSFGTLPAPSCGPEVADRWKGSEQPDGSVRSTFTDGTFEIRLRSAKASYLAGEPIDITATVAYVGASQDAQTFQDQVFFTGKQLDGMSSFDSLTLPLVCHERPLEDLPVDWTLGVGERHGPDTEWVRDHTDGPPTLPEGRWRIRASFEGSVPACPGEGHRLNLSVEITVLDGNVPAATDFALLTSTVPGAPGVCMAALGSGTLSINPRTGLGFETAGVVTDVLWPFGWTARREAESILLFDAGGAFVARMGDFVQFAGGFVADDLFSVCSVPVLPSPWPSFTTQ